MKLFLMLLSVFFLLNGCTPEDRHIDIPDTVQVSKTDAHRRIPGTRVFMVIPKGYKISGTSLKKEDGAEIVIIDSPNRPFDSTKDQEVIPRETTSNVTFFQKNFTLNGYRANIKYGKNKIDKEDKIFFISGDRSFVVVVLTRMPAGNNVDRDEIVGAIKSIVVDTTARVDYSKLNRYSLDDSHSAFKFNKNVAQVFYYTVDGKDEAMMNFVSFVNMPALPDTVDMISCGNSIVKRLEGQMTISSKEAKVVKVNGRWAYEVIMKATKGEVPFNAYMLVMGGHEGSVYCLAYINDNPALFEDCKRLVGTLRLR